MSLPPAQPPAPHPALPASPSLFSEAFQDAMEEGSLGQQASPRVTFGETPTGDATSAPDPGPDKLDSADVQVDSSEAGDRPDPSVMSRADSGVGNAWIHKNVLRRSRAHWKRSKALFAVAVLCGATGLVLDHYGITSNDIPLYLGFASLVLVLHIVLDEVVVRGALQLGLRFLAKTQSGRLHFAKFVFQPLHLPVRVLVETSAVWVMWVYVIDEPIRGTLVDRTFSGILAFAVLLGAKRMTVQRFGETFVESSYLDRIMDAILAEYVLCSMVAPEGQSGVAHLPVTDSFLAIVNRRNVRVPARVTSALVSYLRNNKLPLPSAFDEDEVESRSMAERLARYAFANMKRDKRAQALDRNDFLRFLPLSIAEAGFDLFDIDGDGLVTARELTRKTIEVYRERKALTLSLRDASSLLDALNTVANVVLGAILVLVFLFLYEVDLQSILLSATTLLVAYAFAFGNTVRVFFESAIYVILVHPYDVGDRVYVDGTPFIVQHIDLLTTTMRRWDGLVTYFPNEKLSREPISNMRRSGDIWDEVSIQVDFGTPASALRELQSRLAQFLRAESHDYHEQFDFALKDVANQTWVEIAMWFQHRSNWHDLALRWRRREKFVRFMVKVLQDLEIGRPEMKIGVRGLGGGAAVGDGGPGGVGGVGAGVGTSMFGR